MSGFGAKGSAPAGDPVAAAHIAADQARLRIRRRHAAGITPPGGGMPPVPGPRAHVQGPISPGGFPAVNGNGGPVSLGGFPVRTILATLMSQGRR